MAFKAFLKQGEEKLGYKKRENTGFHIQIEEDELSDFKISEAKHDKGVTPIVILAVALAVLFIASLILIVPYDEFFFSSSWLFEHIKENARVLFSFLFSGNDSFEAITFYKYIAVMIAGAALAVTGCVYQGSFRNVLAGPSTMGVTSGGSIGCMVYVLLFYEVSETAEAYKLKDYGDYTFGELYAQQACVLVGCFGCVFITMLVSSVAGRGRLSPTAMILSGTVLSSLSSAFLMIVQYYMILKDPEDERIEVMRSLMLGSFDNFINLRTLLMFAVPVFICFAVILAISGRLNLLSLGEDEATAMGLNVRFYRYLMIALGTVITGFVVAFCGRIGFLGFMVPLVCRKWAGPDMRKLIPTAMLFGAILLLAIYDIARIANLTSSMNILTSPVGALVMLITLLRRKSGGGKEQGGAFKAGGLRGMGLG